MRPRKRLNVPWQRHDQEATFEQLMKESFQLFHLEPRSAPVSITTDSGAPVSITPVNPTSQHDLGLLKRVANIKHSIDAIEKARLVAPE